VTYIRVKRLLRLEKNVGAGLDFILWELIGSLEVGRCKQNEGRFECEFTVRLWR